MLCKKNSFFLLRIKLFLFYLTFVEYLHCNTRDKRPTTDGVRTSDMESDSGQSLLKGNRLCHSIYDTSKAWTPEDLLTDEFLNKMHIPQGEVKQK
jgi:hypothetical protein